MKRFALLTTVFIVVLVIVFPFVGGGGPGLSISATADTGPLSPALASTTAPATPPIASTTRVTIATTARVTEESARAATVASAAALSHDWFPLAKTPVLKPLPVQAVGVVGSFSPGSTGDQGSATGQSCPGDASGVVGGAPGATSAQGVVGTTSDGLASFAHQYNAIRVANCLQPIPYGNFVYDSCMEARLFWMAESPSPDPLDAWGHMGSVRIDGVPSTGCDGNLAGGAGDSGATVAEKWWNSSAHRASLYRPGSSIAGACIAFAMTHGGIDEPYSFTRAAARWTGC